MTFTTSIRNLYFSFETHTPYYTKYYISTDSISISNHHHHFNIHSSKINQGRGVWTAASQQHKVDNQPSTFIPGNIQTGFW